MFSRPIEPMAALQDILYLLCPPCYRYEMLQMYLQIFYSLQVGIIIVSINTDKKLIMSKINKLFPQLDFVRINTYAGFRD
jgi:hypothetical protein